jgi:hypothetical protein
MDGAGLKVGEDAERRNRATIRSNTRADALISLHDARGREAEARSQP